MLKLDTDFNLQMEGNSLILQSTFPSIIILRINLVSSPRAQYSVTVPSFHGFQIAPLHTAYAYTLVP
jgi:hypothetical protein